MLPGPVVRRLENIGSTHLFLDLRIVFLLGKELVSNFFHATLQCLEKYYESSLEVFKAFRTNGLILYPLKYQTTKPEVF